MMYNCSNGVVQRSIKKLLKIGYCSMCSIILHYINTIYNYTTNTTHTTILYLFLFLSFTFPHIICGIVAIILFSYFINLWLMLQRSICSICSIEVFSYAR